MIGYHNSFGWILKLYRPGRGRFLNVPNGTFVTAVTLFFFVLSIPSAFAVTQCGSFEMVDLPGRVTLMTAFADGTATGIGYSIDNSGTQVIRYFDGQNWAEQDLPSAADGFIFGSSGSTPDGDAWFAGTRTVSVSVSYTHLRAHET